MRGINSCRIRTCGPVPKDKSRPSHLINRLDVRVISEWCAGFLPPVTTGRFYASREAAQGDRKFAIVALGVAVNECLVRNNSVSVPLWDDLCQRNEARGQRLSLAGALRMNPDSCQALAQCWANVWKSGPALGRDRANVRRIRDRSVSNEWMMISLFSFRPLSLLGEDESVHYNHLGDGVANGAKCSDW